MRAVASLRCGALAGLLVLGLASAGAGEAPSASDLVDAGRLLYAEGRLLSGQPVEALVQGDVPVAGTQVLCQSCHGRSGMGTIEGGRIPAALAGPLLFAPEPQRRRPAYDDATLARALREGIDPAGRPLDPLMPRFRLGDPEVAALAAYLRQLGADPSPGVGPASLRVATIIAGDVPGNVERATLDVLQAYVAARNRSGPQRLRGGHFPDQWKETYREWTLDVWRLEGRPESWRAQIEKRYREHPVFALVGGVASGPWQPIHDFCEAEHMPCLLPDTDLPPAGEAGFYSLYFSRGLQLEAEIIAATLAGESRHGNVLTVVRAERDAASTEAAAALARAIERRGGHVRTLEAGRKSELAAALAPAAGQPPSAIVLWLGAEGLRLVSAQLAAGTEGAPLLLSSTLLGGRWDDVPAAVRTRARVAHLRALPGATDPALARFRVWAKARGIRIHEERHQALAYFACLAFAEGTKHMAIYVSRDYLLDLLEHSSTLAPYLPLYDRAGMTPGQRVLSRGGYLVDLSGRQAPAWLVP